MPAPHHRSSHRGLLHARGQRSWISVCVSLITSASELLFLQVYWPFICISSSVRHRFRSSARSALGFCPFLVDSWSLIMYSTSKPSVGDRHLPTSVPRPWLAVPLGGWTPPPPAPPRSPEEGAGVAWGPCGWQCRLGSRPVTSPPCLTRVLLSVAVALASHFTSGVEELLPEMSV